MYPATASGSIHQSVNFICTAEGGPDNVYFWVKDNMDAFGGYSSLDEYLSSMNNGAGAGTNIPIDIDEILSSLDGYILSDNQTLIVTITSGEDGGDYTCAAINEAGYDIDSVTLSVLPYITVHPVNMYIDVSDNTSLSCTANSFPAPNYQWEKYDESSGVFEELLGETSSSLFLNGQYGDYRCVVVTSNGGKVTSNTATITGMIHAHYNLIGSILILYSLFQYCHIV